MDIKDFILIGGGVLIVLVIAHGFWIAFRAKREPYRLDIVPDLIPENEDETSGEHFKRVRERKKYFIECSEYKSNIDRHSISLRRCTERKRQRYRHRESKIYRQSETKIETE